jgi:hypothetical protein
MIRNAIVRRRPPWTLDKYNEIGTYSFSFQDDRPVVADSTSKSKPTPSLFVVF